MPDETLYCICRSSDGKRFMVCCDKCDEWFHGDCINLTEKAAKFIEKYFCQKCIEGDPSLHITYKPAKKSSGDGSSRKNSTKKKREDSRTPSHSSKASSEGPSGKITGDETKQRKISTTESDSSGDDDEWNGQGDPRRSMHIDHDSRRSTSQGKQHGKERSKKDAKQRRPSGSGSVNGAKAQKKAAVKSPVVATARPAVEPGSNVEPEENKNLDDSEEWDSILEMPPPLPVPPEELQGQAAAASAAAQLKSDIKKSPKSGKKSSSSHYLRRNSPRRSPSRDDDEWPGFDWDNLRQCFGPKCRHAAAPGSKYCSDDCGRALARKRLLEYMPTRLEQMGDQNYAATLMNQKDMDIVRKRLQDCKNTLESITARKAALELAIAKGKRVVPISQEDEDSQHAEDTGSDNAEVYCVTCGLPQPLRTAVKHFEKCFNRYENQTSYGSLVPTPNSIFCDVQNPKTKTWCKRLKVLCPEHFRESAEDTAGVCGFPLTDDVFRTSGKFCHSLKKHCSKHPSWERVKRAELDLEILRAYIKMEELAEQEATLMRTIQSRGGIVQSLLNYTTVVQTERQRESNELNGSFGQTGQTGQSSDGIFTS